jgi:HSP20 family molecular chaperone IbpA
MFSKKCPRCQNKVNKGYDFCPRCGFSLRNHQKVGKDNEDNWGMLGENDFIPESQANANINPLAGNFLGPFNGGILNKMLNNAMKMLEKEMQKEMQNIDPEKMQFQPKTNLQVFINGKKVNLSPGQENNGKIILRKNSAKQAKSPSKPVKSIKLPETKLKNFQKLPETEPETNIRRLSDRVIYEIYMPGVKSKKDISITKLENSIEIKAVTKEKAYHKIIKVGLPVINYKFSKETLVLELAAK